MTLRGRTGKQLAAHLGVSGAKVCQELRLLDLPEEVRKDVDAGTIPASPAVEIAKAAPEARSELVRQVKEDGATREQVKEERRKAGKRTSKKPSGPKPAAEFILTLHRGGFSFAVKNNKVVIGGAKVRTTGALVRAARELLAAAEAAHERAEKNPAEQPETRPPAAPPALEAYGNTPLGGGLMTALQLLNERLALYRELELESHTPWLMVLTDGGENVDHGQFATAGRLIRQLEQAGKLRFFAVGVDGADMGQLQTFTTGRPYKLRGLEWKACFAWLYRSLRTVSQAQPGQKVEIQNPIDAKWAE